MTHPLFSVILPVYNAEIYLERCINSILEQDFKDFELIIIDDGSVDSSKSICQGFSSKDPRIRFLSKPNGGVSNTRNCGLELASGKWITFIDSDDYWDKSLLSNYFQYISDESSDLIVIGYYEVDGKQQIPFRLTTDIKLPLIEGLVECTKSSYHGFVWNRLYRRDLIHSNNIRFDETLSYCEDHYFSYCYSYHCQHIQLLSTPLYYHWVHPDSLSSRITPEDILSVAYKEKDICKQILRKNPSKDFRRIVRQTYTNKAFTGFSILYNDKTLSRKFRIHCLSLLLPNVSTSLLKILDSVIHLAYKIKRVVKK